MSNTALIDPSPKVLSGIYIRNNLASTGQVPEASPFNLSPDIIQSETQVSDPQDTFSTQQSWSQSYGTAPTAETNYYYVRGINGGAVPVNGAFSLYWAPAQVLNLPSAWQTNPVMTAAGQSDVPVSAKAGHIGVGQEAFVLPRPGLACGSTYFNFIAQMSSATSLNPVPPVASWLDLANLLANNPAFGFRNQAMVDGAATEWVERQILTVPSTFAATKLNISLSAKGFAGTKIGLLCDSFTPAGDVISISPTVVAGDGTVVGLQANVQPGFNTSLGIFFWNDTGTPLAPGSTLTMVVTVPVEKSDPAFEAAMANGLFNAGINAEVERALGFAIGPTPMMIVGQVSFTVAAPVTDVL